jgi:hypothetical protein
MAMISGNDISHAAPIIEKAAEYLKAKENTLESACSCFKRAFQERVSGVAADRVLSRFGLDMQEFLRNGKKNFDSGTFASLCNEIRQVTLSDLAFLNYGFDKDGTPHLFCIDEPGESRILDKPGFCAIGSGLYPAESLLHYLNQSRFRTLEETVYNVCAAKFMAERASGVGKDTFLFVSKHGSSGFSYKDEDLVFTIRDEWDKYGAPRLPPSTLEVIRMADICCLPRHSPQERDQILKGPDAI